MRKILVCTFPLLALAACHSSVKLSDSDDNTSDGNVHIAMNEDNKVSVDVPGFSAKVSMPNMNLGGHLDLDGIKVAPDTKVSTMDVTAHDNDGDKDDGKVRIGFTNPSTPAVVIGHYAQAAKDAGYGDIAQTPTALTARKEQKTFSLTVSPQGAGSQGTIVIAGKD
jgi:hypothetical protein